MIAIYIALIYFALINITASLMAAIDKGRAVKGKWRISEKSLMLVGLMGGAAGEFLTLKAIHHKTKHAKFMVGLPLEIFLHLVMLALIIYKVAFAQA